MLGAVCFGPQQCDNVNILTLWKLMSSRLFGMILIFEMTFQTRPNRLSQQRLATALVLTVSTVMSLCDPAHFAASSTTRTPTREGRSATSTLSVTSSPGSIRPSLQLNDTCQSERGYQAESRRCRLETPLSKFCSG